jgi:hypothetical protein
VTRGRTAGSSRPRVGAALVSLVVGMTTVSALGQQPLTEPIASIDPSSGSWGDFALLSGPALVDAVSVQAIWYPNDDDTQPPAMSQTVTVRGRPNPDALQVQIPADPATSGWSGNFARGALRLYVVLRGQPRPLLAARFYVGGAGANRLTSTVPTRGNVRAGATSVPSATVVGAQSNAATPLAGGSAVQRPVRPSPGASTAMHVFVLAGFSARGSSLTAPPHSFELAGFSASGRSQAVRPHTIVSRGFAAHGIASTAVPHAFVLAGWTGVGSPRVP